MEDYLCTHYARLGLEGVFLGRQVLLTEDDNTSIDVLVLLRDGRLCIIETKRATADESAIIQLLKYASWLSCPDQDVLDKTVREQNGCTMAELYARRYRKPLPAGQLGNVRLILVAADFDTTCARIARFLTGVVQLDLQLMRFQPQITSGQITFAFQNFLKPTNSRNIAVQPPPGRHYLLQFNRAQYFSQDWCGGRGYLVLPDSTGEQSDFTHLQAGDILYAHLRGTGYVGCAAVESLPRGWASGTASPILIAAKMVLPIRWMATRSLSLSLHGPDFPPPEHRLQLATPHLAQSLWLGFGVQNRCSEASSQGLPLNGDAIQE